MDGVSSYDMANYIIVPLGVTPNGSSVYLRIPTDEGNRLVGGVLIKGLQRDRAKYITDIIDYMAGQAPTINPALDALISAVQYATGRNPYDAFRGRYAISEQIFAAQDERTHKAFAKWLANKSGSTIIYRFQYDDLDRVKSELERVLDYPIVSNIIGRFIKVSQAGIREDIKIERELAKRENARKILDAKKALTKILNEEPLTEKDSQALIEKPDVFDRNFIDGLARKYGSVVAEELWSVYQTGTAEEKAAVINKIEELNAVNRTGENYRWIWKKKK
ncbi:MAG: hypothetical protein GTO12_12030 [Proteobacteria bacterium]|nr:hypothetical protein [Pseudomonadota bacterium]